MGERGREMGVGGKGEGERVREAGEKVPLSTPTYIVFTFALVSFGCSLYDGAASP